MRWRRICLLALAATMLDGAIPPAAHAAGPIREFLIRGAAPVDITVGPDGNLWFTEDSGIGRITPSGVRTEFRVPTNGSGPNGITVGPTATPGSPSTTGPGSGWFGSTNSGRFRA